MDAIEQRNQQLWNALSAIKPELDPAMRTEYEALSRAVAESSNPRAKALALADLTVIIQRIPAFRARLKSELDKREQLAPFLREYLIGYAADQSLPALAVDAAVESLLAAIDMELAPPNAPGPERTITLPKLEKGPAKSLKLSNFRLKRIPEVASEGVLLSHEVRDAGPLLIAAGAIVLIATLRGTLTRTIDSHQASVLWAILHLAQPGEFVREADIEPEVNRVRTQAGFGALASGTIAAALAALRADGSVERRGATDPEWRIIEKVETKE